MRNRNPLWRIVLSVLFVDVVIEVVRLLHAWRELERMRAKYANEHWVRGEAPWTENCNRHLRATLGRDES